MLLRGSGENKIILAGNAALHDDQGQGVQLDQDNFKRRYGGQEEEMKPVEL
jgi:hypothetical protein